MTSNLIAMASNHHPGLIVLRYQTLGFAWMASNVRNGLGCLLADDMGLGKTLQTISLLLHLKEHQKLGKKLHPALVVSRI